MSNASVASILEEFSDYPRFDDGRIDYHDVPKAAVINVVVECDGQILLLKRSQEVHTYKGKWMTVAGYLDESVSPEEKALEELEEEIGLTQQEIRSLKAFEPMRFTDDGIGTTFVIFPVLARLDSKPDVMLDFEHTDMRWIEPEKIDAFDAVPSFPKVLQTIFSQ